MRNLKSISPIAHPLLGEIRRKALYGMIFDPFKATPSISVIMHIKHYRYGEVTLPGQPAVMQDVYIGDLIADKYDELKADNTTFVNGQGQFVEPGTEGAIGEYDFFIQLAASGQVNIFDLLDARIDLADSLGRFNG